MGDRMDQNKIRRRQWGARDLFEDLLSSWKSESATTRPSCHFYIFQSGNMSQMLGMLEMQGMQPHNVQQQPQSSHPTIQDFQTRKIDVTQKMPEMSGMLGMQPAGHKKGQQHQDLLIFPKNQPSKADTSNSLQIP